MTWLHWLFVGSSCAVILGLILWPMRQRSPQEILEEVNREERSRRGL